jgi:TonB family protein
MRCRHSTLLLVAALLLLTAATPREGAEPKPDSDFWGNIAEPGRKKFLEALRRGRALFETAERVASSQLKARTFEDALAAFQEAARASPRNADGPFWIGKTLYQLDRIEETIRAFKRVRQLKPDFADDYKVSFTLGIAYSKLNRFEEAVQEYDRAERVLATRGLGASDAGFGRALLHANAAESLMAIGHLDDAIQRYLDAIALYPSYKLAWWGLAVAYDRDEQVSKAIDAVQKAIAGDSNMGALTQKDVFFVPGGDVHYYFALGHQVRGDAAAAKKAWEQFLAELPKSQWAFRARDHLAALGASKPSGVKDKRLAPTPSGGTTVEAATGGVQDQIAARYRLQGYLYRMRQCYQKELKASSKLAGQLRLSFVVSKEGRVKDVKVVQSTIKRPALATCIIDVIKGAYFNRPSSGDVKVVFPMEFKPSNTP